MGSCVSPVVANIFMEHIERQGLATFREPLTIWLRYVDDVFCVIKSSAINELFTNIFTLFRQY